MKQLLLFFSLLFLLQLKSFSQCTANAGPDVTACANSASSITLNATVSGGATGGTWTSSGTGAFSPNAVSLNASYAPSAADITAGGVTLTLTTTGCGPVTDVMVITITPSPTVNAGLDQTICVNTGVATMNGTVTNATAGVWAITSGPGATITNPSSLNTPVNFAAAGTYTITLTSIGNGLCNAVNDLVVMTVLPSPAADAGPGQTICLSSPGAPLAGNVVQATGGTWTSDGTGTFTPNATTLDASYIPSVADKARGYVGLTLTTTGNGMCTANSDTTVIIIAQDPTVNAGPDLTVCSGSNVNLSGAVTNAGGGTWITSGSGSFSDSYNLTTVYTPSPSDISNGSFTLSLTTTGTGACSSVTDQMTINIIPGPAANAGPDQAVCHNFTSVTLSGSISGGATGATWTSIGSGVFIPNASTLNATYVPSLADDSLTLLTFSLTPTGGVSCSAYDQMVVSILHPRANAGGNRSMCTTMPIIGLNGNVSEATGGSWSTSGTGTFSPNSVSLNATYTPSANDLLNGFVNFTLTTTGNGACLADTDHIVINFVTPPTIDAGPDQSTCISATAIDLHGSLTGGSSTYAYWVTSGTGTFDSLQTSRYLPSPADISAGSVTLTYITYDLICSTVSDQMTIYFSLPVPAATASSNQSICGNASANFSAAVTAASNGNWTTSGTGTFNNSNALNTTYTPSTSDRVAGGAVITFTTEGAIGCTASVNLSLTLTSSPTVDAGVNQSLNSGPVSLAGTVTGATGGQWSTSGTGNFMNINNLNDTYLPSAGDIAAGKVTLTLISTGNGTCPPVSDHMMLTANAQVCNVTITATATDNSINFRATNNDGTSLGSYVWNFDDGTSAIGIVQNHVYAAAGSYNASVFYTTEDSSCSVIEYQMITITSVVIPTYSLSGTVKAGASNLDNGVVSLFKLINSNYSLLQTLTIGAGGNGSFSFSNLDNGTYILQASLDPNSIYFSSYSPTYFGNTADWSTATQLIINNHNLSSNIIDLMNYVSPDVTWNTGTDTLSGTITFDASQPLRVSAFSVNPAAYAIVNLYNSNNVLLTSTVTDDFGYYEFPDLIGGTYTIKVDYAGGTSSNITTVLDGNPATDEKANTQVIKQSIATGLSQTQFISVAGAKMYPNPASAELNIELPSEANGASTISIYNAMGQLQYKEEHNIISNNNISLNVQSLAPGLHIVEVMNGNKIYKGKLSKN